MARFLVPYALLRETVGVVWIDAHADLHTPLSTPSGNVHGMPLAAALGHDNRAYQINKVTEDTLADWEQMKSLGTVTPILQPEHLIYFGVRDTEIEEDKFSISFVLFLI